MKSLLPSILVACFCAALSLGGTAPPNRPIVLDSSIAAARSPLCECEPCECKVCECAPAAEVGPPPDSNSSIFSNSSLVAISGGEVQPVRAIYVPANPTQPAPVAPKPKAAAVPQVYQQQSYGSCGPGGCGRRGIFGRRR